MRSSLSLVAIAAVFVVVLPARADYAAAVKADGPIAYWRLNEATGSTQFQPEAGFGTISLDAYDGDGALLGAVNDSGPEAGIPGVPFADEPDNKAVFLPNTGPYPWFPTRYQDYLVTNSAIDLSGTGDWTLEMWFRHADADASGYPWGANSTAEDLMGNEDLGVTTDAFLIEIDSGGAPDHLPTTFRMRTRYDVAGANTVTDFKPEVPEGADWATWHHVVFTTLQGTGSVYLDGSLVGSTPWNGTVTSTGEILAFGQDRNWKGDLDEIALYNKGLTETQVAAHYAAADLDQPVPGDFNGDGNVDTADYTIWADNYTGSGGSGGTPSTGDANGDGAVDTADYTIWADNYTGSSAAGSIVPEPSTLVSVAGLCLAAWLAFGARPKLKGLWEELANRFSVLL